MHSKNFTLKQGSEKRKEWFKKRKSESTKDEVEESFAWRGVEVVNGECLIMWSGGLHGCRNCLHPTSIAASRHGGALHDYGAG